MRFSTAQSYQKEQGTVSIRNNNAAVAILDGQPVILDNNNVSGVNLGVDVKRVSEGLGTSPFGLLLGIAKAQTTDGIIKGNLGEAVVYGFTDAIVTTRTRAASTDTWASVASFGAGDALVPETDGNNLKWQNFVPATTAIAVASHATGATAVLNVTYPVFLRINAGESMNSIATAGSAARNGSLLYDTARMKVFVRLMG